MSRALCLDLSSRTGWCVVGDGPITFGFWDLAIEIAPGRMMASLRNEILDVLEDRRARVRHLVIEQTLPAHRQTRAASATQQGDLAAAVKLLSYDQGLQLHVVTSASARVSAFGRGNGAISAKDKLGGKIVRMLRERDFDVMDHNAADAIVLALWFRKKGAQ